jgi:protein SCO1
VKKQPSSPFFPQLAALILIACIFAAASQALNQPAHLTAIPAQEIHLPLAPGTQSQVLPVYGQLSDFSFIESNGKVFGSENLRKHVWIADFIYTSCTTECPLMSAEMARLQNKLSELKDIRLVSFTVDPEVDTPSRLAEYAERFQAQADRWKFLTGQREKLYALAQKDFHLPAQANDAFAPNEHHSSGEHHGTASDESKIKENPFLHSQKFVLVDQDLQIRGYYDSTRSEEMERLLKTDLPRLLQKP